MSSIHKLLEPPKDGIKGLTENWQSDIFASFLVFMLALPLALSVAVATQLPVSAGILSALVGSLMISFLSGSQLTIKSPSISFVPIILVAIHTLGYHENDYRFFMAALVVAGALQILLGLVRAGNILSILPEAVLYGLLASLGLILVLHQVYYLLGSSTDAYTFWGLLGDIPNLFFSINGDIAIIGVLSLLILFGFSSLQFRYINILPIPMIIILLGIALTFFMNIPGKYEGNFLVELPETIIPDQITANFSKWANYNFIELVLLLVLVASLETILNVRSIDALDFFRRKSKLNRELMAMGLGNAICGLLGAVPIISSMERSATNVNGGAKTRWANFFHGLFFILFTVLLLGWVTWIPVASFAAIVIYFSFKLISPKLLNDIQKIGKDQLFLFVITFVASASLGILIGLLVGIISTLGIYLYLKADFKSLFNIKIRTVDFGNNRYTVKMRSEALASNYLILRKELKKYPPDAHIYLDFTKSPLVDYTFLELVYHYAYSSGRTEGSIELQGLEDHKTISEHPLATRKMIKKRRFEMQNMSTNFNERQLDVLGVASINNAKLRHHLTYDGSKLQGFSFSLGYEIKYRENKFTKKHDFAKLELSDIFLSKGLRMSEQSHKMTVLLVTDIEKYIPAFHLSKEGIFSKIVQVFGYDDIDFDEYPEFSDRYLLTGANPNEIRNFFDNEMLEFFEEHQGFQVESRNNNLLIYRERHLMTRTEMEDTIEFAETFLDIIHKVKTEVLTETIF